MKVLALTKYGSLAASTRQRFMLYESYLRREGVELEYATFLGNDYLAPLLRGERPSVRSVVTGYFRRLLDLAGSRRFDALWLQYEFLPYFPGAIEWLSAKCAGRPILVDYDDAIFHQYDDSRSSLVRMLLADKLAPLLRNATACSCGNEYVRAFAAQYCRQTAIFPTVVDTDTFRPGRRKESDAVIIGWIGSPSTWKDVRPVLPKIAQLCSAHGVRFRVIGAGSGAVADRFEGMDLVDWSEASELAELQSMDIGIMPVSDQPFQRGKSGYKLVQYMACGLPVVASSIGANRDMVDEGENGFLVWSPDDWIRALGRLVEDPSLRSTLGQAGRLKAEREYSLHVHAPRMVELLKSVAGKQ